MSLKDLCLGDKAKIIALDHDENTKYHLFEMGVHPGEIIKKIHHAPFGGISIYEIAGYQLCLRTIDAKAIAVNKI